MFKLIFVVWLFLFPLARPGCTVDIHSLWTRNISSITVKMTYQNIISGPDFYKYIYSIFQFTQHLRGAGKRERCCSPGRRRRRRRRYYWWRDRLEETADGLSGQPEPPRGKPQPSSQNIQSDLWRQQRKLNYYKWEYKISVFQINYLVSCLLHVCPVYFIFATLLLWFM